MIRALVRGQVGLLPLSRHPVSPKAPSREGIIARRNVIRSDDVAAVRRQYESCRYFDLIEPVDGVRRPLPEFRLAQEIALGPSHFHHQNTR
jgi:hypothetical protein